MAHVDRHHPPPPAVPHPHPNPPPADSEPVWVVARRWAGKQTDPRSNLSHCGPSDLKTLQFLPSHSHRPGVKAEGVIRGPRATLLA